MRVKEMHPLCCISLESPATGADSPDVLCLSRNGSVSGSTFPLHSGSDGNAVGSALGSDASVAGVLYKWTNYGKGWRSRWFVLRNGVLSYCKIRLLSENLNSSGDEVRVIGDVSSARLSRMDSCGRRKQPRSKSVVHLKVSSYRESRSDERKFYIFTATKTLHLRTNSRKEKEAWVEALASSRGLFTVRGPINDSLPLSPNDLSISTEMLRKRLVEEGTNESLVRDCEAIMRSEFSEVQGQLKILCEERSTLLDTLRQLEAANIEAEGSGLHDSDYRLTKDEYHALGRGKYCEYSTTETSDDIEKQELEDVSDEEETSYYDTKDCFSDSHIAGGPISQATGRKVMQPQQAASDPLNLKIVRRKKLPDPVEKEKAVSLWSLIKDNVGKDLTRVCLPVYFNEPLSSLQKCCEDLEYSYLLDRAFEHGKAGNSLLRMVNVAAFAASGYASSEGRLCKPFNPLLGETYEADFPDKGIRFFSEKVSHHPTVIACHCEGRGWKFWGDSNLKTKFWGPSIQLDPVGVLTVEFDDGEIFQWSKVTTSIYNVILGKIYCDHHGTMHIRGNRQLSCKLKFKGQTILDRNPHQVQGVIEDVMGNKVATLSGKWDESLYYDRVDGNGRPKDRNTTSEASLLWTRVRPPSNLTRYNFTSFAITLNELTPGLQEKLPPTDSRLRPDQRYLENGEYERANVEKLRLEKRQRMSRTLQEKGWRPRWFQKEGENGSYRYIGGYWEARDQRKWDDCPSIFNEDVNDTEGS